MYGTFDSPFDFLTFKLIALNLYILNQFILNTLNWEIIKKKITNVVFLIIYISRKKENGSQKIYFKYFFKQRNLFIESNKSKENLK